ncbi:hypothetical protein BS47DRAFT_99527 [Hydnum rufescens UP504]|uniref:C3H1-type domain-containing protein n=1 Tax=Hydnum rufescens UP504 TaxID=1448309 RepID=A0A9P6DQJ8_9AGAM|nr:hypothetical protein BS47DRAFT_99527 [Hydnum rufescens UP504]
MTSKNSLEKSKTHGKGNKNYRTVLCARYVAGYCEYDDDCWFIHGTQGLIPPPDLPPRLEVATTTMEEATPAPKTFKPAPLSDRVKMHPCYKTQPCYSFLRSGQCAKGDYCTFRHDESMPSNPPSPVHRRSASGGKQPCFDFMRTGVCPKDESCIFSHEATARYAHWYRRVDCKLYLAGECKHGDTCLFRHPSPAGVSASTTGGSEATSDRTTDPLYRTKPCLYFREGSCSRGSNCTYIHDISPNSSLSFATRSPPSSFGADSSETAVPSSRSIGSPRSELDYHDDDGDDDVVYQPPQRLGMADA